jgi:DNA primase
MRRGRVYLDTNRNAYAQTVAAPIRFARGEAGRTFDQIALGTPAKKRSLSLRRR